MTELKINGKNRLVDVEEDTPLLWAIRDTVGLTGTKYGCGIQQCGACTVLIGKRPVRSCGITVGEVVGKDITTIEGLSEDSKHPVQLAWIEEQVPHSVDTVSPGRSWQQSHCWKGNQTQRIRRLIRGMLNLCRCGTYPRIRKAIHRASDLIKEVS